MNLEKLGLLFLINYFNQLGTVKNHVLLAFREILMAVQTSLDIVSQSSGAKILGTQFDLLNPILSKAQSVVSYGIEKVTPPQEQNVTPLDDGKRIKDHIVKSIISAIDDEMSMIKDSTLEKNKLKIEALHTVKQVLLNQKSKPLDSSVLASDKKYPHKTAHVA